MVSLQTALSTKERSFYCSSPTSAPTTFVDPSKKRRREDQFKALEEEGPSKELKLFFRTTNNNNNYDNNNNRIANNDDESRSSSCVELQLEDAPLPPDWQRCLDIESGQITFYNTRTKSRTSRDPRRCSPPLLNLDLNLSFELVAHKKEGKEEEEEGDVIQEEEKKEEDEREEEKKVEDVCLPLWTSSPKVDKRAMVATVCMHCHMLVMMCKTSPLCPNCKFLHPHTPTDAKQFLSYGK